MIYPKAIRVSPLENFMLHVEFDNGEEGLFDVRPYIQGEWFGELADEAVFRTVRIAGLSVEWENGQDIAPDCLYHGLIHTT